MELLPPELCQQIFSLACTDGGFTGLSLTRVSRYIRNVSALVRFQRICIRGAVQLRWLAAALDAGGSTDVRHLFLADHTNDDALLFDGWAPPRQPCPENRWAKLMRKARLHSRRPVEARTFIMTCAERDAEMQTLVARILARAAPTLRSLVLCLTTPMPFVLVPPALHFPLLEELWCVHSTCTFVVPPPGRAPLSQLHALRRLHLSAYFHPEVLLHVARIAPALTHLRLSDICAAPAFPQYVEALLDLPPARARRTAALPGSLIPAPLPQSTMHVAVQPADEADLGEVNKRMAFSLRTMTEHDVQSRLIYLEEAGLYRLQRARVDWLAQMEGGDGCWRRPVPIEEEDVHPLILWFQEAYEGTVYQM